MQLTTSQLITNKQEKIGLNCAISHVFIDNNFRLLFFEEFYFILFFLYKKDTTK